MRLVSVFVPRIPLHWFLQKSLRRAGLLFLLKQGNEANAPRPSHLGTSSTGFCGSIGKRFRRYARAQPGARLPGRTCRRVSFHWAKRRMCEGYGAKPKHCLATVDRCSAYIVFPELSYRAAPDGIACLRSGPLFGCDTELRAPVRSAVWRPVCLHLWAVGLPHFSVFLSTR